MKSETSFRNSINNGFSKITLGKYYSLASAYLHILQHIPMQQNIL